MFGSSDNPEDCALSELVPGTDVSGVGTDTEVVGPVCPGTLSVVLAGGDILVPDPSAAVPAVAPGVPTGTVL